MLLFFAKPKTFILVFLVVSPLINIFWFYRILDFSIVDIFSGIFPVFFILLFIANLSKRRWLWGGYNKYFLIILVAFLIPLLRSIIIGESFLPPLKLFIKIFCGYASYNLFLNYFDSEEKEKVKNIILYAVAITMSMVVFQLFTGIGKDQDLGFSMKGLYHDPGQYTRMALLGFIITLPVLNQIRSKIRYVSNFLLLCICLVTLGFSISRNVVLSLGVIIIVYSLLMRRFLLVLFVIIFGFVIYFSSPAIQEGYEYKFIKEIEYLRSSNIPIETLGSGRIGTWQRTISDFGQASYFVKVFGEGRDIGPHGQVHGLLKSVGIFGLLATILFYLKLLSDTFAVVLKEKNNTIALYSFLITVAVFIMSVGSAPITEFYQQMILFAFIALLEKNRYMNLGILLYKKPVINFSMPGFIRKNKIYQSR